MSWAAPAVGLDCLFRGERCLYEWSSTSKHEEDCPSAEDGLEVKCSVTENTKVSGRKRKHLLRFTTQLVRTKRVRGDLFASSVPWRLCVQSRLCCTSACSVVKTAVPRNVRIWGWDSIQRFCLEGSPSDLYAISLSARPK